MSKIAVVLKGEIVRLARKETRVLTRALRNALAQQRKAMAVLKRDYAATQKKLAQFAKQLRSGAAPARAEAAETKIRFSVASAKSQRKRLGLSAADMGALIGVTGQTIYSWEHGGSRPRKSQVAAFAALRGIGRREAGKRLAELRSQPAKKARKARK